MVELIYCAAGNPRFAAIAVSAGYRYGARLPGTVYQPVYFADQDYKRPDRPAYMAALARHRPAMATVLDWEQAEQLPTVLDWAEEAAQHAARVVIVPKVPGAVDRLPRRIGGADVVLGYSIPTSYGGTQVPAWELAGWPLHLLGGSPNAQMRTYLHLAAVADVVSADGNYAQKLATRHCQFWQPGTARGANNRWWPTLKEADGRCWECDGPYEAFRRSCIAIRAAWAELTGEQAA